MTNKIIISHKNCLDGAAAAAVVKRRYPASEVVFRNYGEAPPDVKGRDLFIVDFSFPAETMRKLKEEAASVTWIDHHKTALETQAELGWGKLSMEECGATLTWFELGIGSMPPILPYIKDRDLWQWSLKDSKAISEALKDKFLSLGSPPFDLDIDPQSLVEPGRELIRKMEERVKSNCNKIQVITLDGHRTGAVNCYTDISETGDRLVRELGYSAALMYWHSGKHWVYSLRGDTVDVSVMAKKRGGGGHVKAAGFHSTSLLPELTSA